MQYQIGTPIILWNAPMPDFQRRSSSRGRPLLGIFHVTHTARKHRNRLTGDAWRGKGAAQAVPGRRWRAVAGVMGTTITTGAGVRQEHDCTTITTGAGVQQEHDCICSDQRGNVSSRHGLLASYDSLIGALRYTIVVYDARVLRPKLI